MAFQKNDHMRNKTEYEKRTISLRTDFRTIIIRLETVCSWLETAFVGATCLVQNVVIE